MAKSTNSKMVRILQPRNRPRLPPISPADKNENMRKQEKASSEHD